MDLDRLWKNTQEEIKIVLAPAVFNTFIAQTQLIALQHHTATISCPNSYLVDINQKRYYRFFKEALDHQSQLDLTLEFIVQEPIKNQDSLPPPPLFTPSQTSSSPSFRTNLHPSYTFDNFIVGNSNNFAFAAAQGIVKNPGTTYNPFFLWGGVGVGKTHLMQAIGWQLLHHQPNLKVKYFPAETFGNELVAALRTKTINQFKDKYRFADCILVDDIQFIAGKEYIQEEFFHTFNALHLSGRQIILTSDRKPQDIKDLQDRLVSRFTGGLTVDIQPPDLETRTAIIRQKVEESNLNIDPLAIDTLAQSTNSNIRQLEGQLRQLFLQAQSQNLTTISPLFVQSFLNPSSTTNNRQSNSLTPRHLISVCARYFNIKTGDLCGQARQKNLVTARHFTAYLLISELKLPLKEVGHLLGGRDHTSIMHARDKIQSDLSTSPPTQQVIHQIKQLLL